ncbi:MAG: TatD family hydrolase [Thermoleophilia bacterium]
MITLPTLDCHAHIAPNVTQKQLSKLAPAVVFAVTRSPAEAREVAKRADERVIWGAGLHPSYVGSGGDFDVQAFRGLLTDFAFVGEVGLDRRSGDMDRQVRVLESLLAMLEDQPVLISIHSSGCVEEVLDLLERHVHSGAILHWFTGNEKHQKRAAQMGCYFSVNSAMDESLLTTIPFDRILPETDYPAIKKSKVLPGDTTNIEALIAKLHHTDVDFVRRQFYRNLRVLALATKAIDRMPSAVSDLLLIA